MYHRFVAHPPTTTWRMQDNEELVRWTQSMSVVRAWDHGPSGAHFMDIWGVATPVFPPHEPGHVKVEYLASGESEQELSAALTPSRPPGVADKMW